MSISDRFSEVQQNIRRYADGRAVTLVAVSKYATVEQMKEAYQAGARHFGENRVPDALAKIAEFPTEQYPDLHWHLIGSLQTNKAKKTVGQFSLIQSVDSTRLAEAISDPNLAENRVQDVLLQVNLSNDLERHGFLPEDLPTALKPILSMKGIRVRGLMGIAPPEASLENDEAALKRIFCGLRDLNAQLAHDFGIDLPELSMGMSHDYVHALQCGATIIRLGNFLFKN
jgi:pyridoxal phosphate enzyme (YggS family)